MARRLLASGHWPLERAVQRLTEDLHSAPSNKERLRTLTEDWELRLPIASAVLTVLYPEAFTVYDVRVCEALGGFHDLANKTAVESICKEYTAFVEAVRASTPRDLSLRDKDRYLWAESFVEQLEADVQQSFGASRSDFA